MLKVSYDDAQAFYRWLSEQTDSAVRLPTEAEWLYAARGGIRSQGFVYAGGNDKDEVSWNADNSGNRPHPVGTKKPNELGLFDMSGNLWEWCSDWPATPAPGSPRESGGPGRDAKHVLCGDSYGNPGTRTGYRISVRLPGNSRHINIGFRLAKSD